MKRFKKSIVAIGAAIIGFGFLSHIEIFDNQINENVAYANSAPNPATTTQGVASTDNQSLLDLAAFLDLFLNFLYIIIRPLLAITGLALDNSLVYGEVFGMTTILRRFWTVMMQISFLLLTLAILRDIASGLREKKDLGSIMTKKLKSRILAGIFIPMSRFLVSALVDLSTVLIYQVGGIPLSVLKSDDSLNVKILNNHSVINLTDSLLSDSDQQGGYRFSTLYSCGSESFTVCKFEQDKITPTNWDKYITDTKAKYPGYNISKEYCVLSPTMLMATNNGNIDLRDDSQLAAAIAAGTGYMETSLCASINSLIDSSKSMVGPLYTIYGSLLNFTSLNVTVSGKSTEAEVILFLLKGIVGLLLIIPLIALAATSIARIGILRIVIAFSPFIVLYKFLGGSGGNSVISDLGKNLSFNWGKGMMEYKPDLSGIIDLIFQPVLVVLALGISLIFLSATNKILGPAAEKDGLLQAIGIEVDNTDSEYQTFKVHNNGEHTTDIAIQKFDGEYATSIFFDYFTWIIANIFGILIMRNMMFMALKSASLTKGIANKVQSIGEDYLSTRPIFGGYSWNSINEVAGEVTDAAVKKLTEDTTVDNAKKLSNFWKARIPGSKAYNDHNSNFAIKGPVTDVSAADALANGISKVGSDNKNFHYVNTKDTPALKPISTQLNLGGNLEDMVAKAEFWEKTALSKEASGAFAVLNKAITNDETAANLVGNNKAKIAQLRTGIQDGTKKVLASYATVGTDGVFTGYKKNASMVSLLQTEADPQKQAMIKAITSYSFGKTDKSNLDNINSALNGKADLYSKIASDFGIQKYDDPANAKANEVFLNTSNNTNRFEFKS